MAILEEDDSYAMKLLDEMGLNKVEISRKINSFSIDDIFQTEGENELSGMVFPKFNKIKRKEKYN